MTKGFQDVRKNSEKKNCIPCSLACKPDCSNSFPANRKIQTSCMMRRDRDAFVKRKQKNEADVFCFKRKQAELQASECTRKLMQELMITSQCRRMPQQKRTWQVLPFFSAYCYIQLHRTVTSLLSFGLGHLIVFWTHKQNKKTFRNWPCLRPQVKKVARHVLVWVHSTELISISGPRGKKG